MEILYIVYANSQEHPLPHLQAEADAVYQALLPRALKQHYFPIREPYAAVRKMAAIIASYRHHLSVFAFSGHAGQSSLFFDGEEARAYGIAQLLGECKNLKFVLLNGCSTRAQVAVLLEKGVPAVIATSAPVADLKARRFAECLFQALAERNTLGEAIALAAAEAQSAAALNFQRKLVVDEEEDVHDIGSALWGVYYQEEAALAYKLPDQAAPEPDIRPNELLVDALWDALPEAVKEAEMAVQQQKIASLSIFGNGTILSVPVDILSKQQVVLRSYPSPISIHLSRLFSPVKAEDQGFDKFGERRLRQLDRTFQFLVELLAYALLAQLWDYQAKRPDLSLSDEQRAALSEFLKLAPEQRAVYDYRQVIRAVASVLTAEAGELFIEEYPTVRELVYENEGFMAAYFTLDMLRQQLYQQRPLGTEEAARLCIVSEGSLAKLLSHTGFLSRYTVHTTRHIDVHKFRHRPMPVFDHLIDQWVIGLNLGARNLHYISDRILDNWSVLLFRVSSEKNSETSELNLTPFVIDANAFHKKPGDIPHIYFFYHYDTGTDAYFYRDVLRPHEPMLSISSKDTFPLEVVFEQWTAFRKLLNRSES